MTLHARTLGRRLSAGRKGKPSLFRKSSKSLMTPTTVGTCRNRTLCRPAMCSSGMPDVPVRIIIIARASQNENPATHMRRQRTVLYFRSHFAMLSSFSGSYFCSLGRWEHCRSITRELEKVVNPVLIMQLTLDCLPYSTLCHLSHISSCRKTGPTIHSFG